MNLPVFEWLLWEQSALLYKARLFIVFENTHALPYSLTFLLDVVTVYESKGEMSVLKVGLYV